MDCGIYQIQNTKNGMSYIGQSIDLKQRLAQQKSDLKAGRHQNGYLQNDASLFGIHSLYFKVLAYCSPTELDDLEKFYIKKYSSNVRSGGYNIEDGGRRDRQIPMETRLRQSKARIGKPQPDSAKSHWSQVRKGAGNSRARKVQCIVTKREWACAKYAADEVGFNYYTLMSKLSGKDKNDTSLRFVNGDGRPRKSRPVIDTVTGKEWISYSEAAEELGLNSGTLRKYLGGQRKNITNLVYAGCEL